MSTLSSAPGVYYESVDAGRRPVTPLRTDITGFVGIAERGPLDVPGADRVVAAVRRWFGGVHAAPATSRMRCARSSRTAAGAAGWCGSPQRQVVRRARRRSSTPARHRCRRVAGRVADPRVEPGDLGERARGHVREHNPAQTSVVATASMPTCVGPWPTSAASPRGSMCASASAGRPAAWTGGRRGGRRSAPRLLGAPGSGPPSAVRRTADEVRRQTAAVLVESVEYTIARDASPDVSSASTTGLTLVPEHAADTRPRGCSCGPRGLRGSGVPERRRPVPPGRSLVEDAAPATVDDLTGTLVDPFAVLALVGGQRRSGCPGGRRLHGRSRSAPDDGPSRRRRASGAGSGALERARRGRRWSRSRTSQIRPVEPPR